MSIVANKKAFHDYFIEEKLEAGIALEGWEVKAIRGGRASIKEAYVVIRNGEIFLFGMHITPLLDADGNPLADFNGRADNGADVNGILECVGSTAHLPTHEAVLDALATEGPNQPDGTLSRALYACGTQASPH